MGNKDKNKDQGDLAPEEALGDSITSPRDDPMPTGISAGRGKPGMLPKPSK